MMDELLKLVHEHVVIPVVLFILNSIWPIVYHAGEWLLCALLAIPLNLIEWLHAAVDVFSGVQTITAPNGQATDLVGYFFGQAVVLKVFWGVTLIAAVLCLAFSIIAVVRSMGDSTLNRPVGKVLGSTAKAMVTFLLIPFMCIFAVNMAGLVLRQVSTMIDSAGDGGKKVYVSSALFAAAVTPEAFSPGGADTEVWYYNKKKAEFELVDPDSVGGGSMNDWMTTLLEEAGYSLDEINLESSLMFGSETEVGSGLSPVRPGIGDRDSTSIRDILAPTPESESEPEAGGSLFGTSYSSARQYILNNKLFGLIDSDGVGDSNLDLFATLTYNFNFYAMFSENYMPLFIACWFYLILLLMIFMIFIRRVFELIVLYIVSPFFVSAIPLDDGAKFKVWREQFISKTVAGFGSIITLKIYILFLPLIWEDSFHLHAGAVVDFLLKLLLMVGGIYATYKSHTLISSIMSERGAASERESVVLMQGMMNSARGMAMAPGGFAKMIAMDRLRSHTNTLVGAGEKKVAGGIVGVFKSNKNPGLSAASAADSTPPPKPPRPGTLPPKTLLPARPDGVSSDTAKFASILPTSTRPLPSTPPPDMPLPAPPKPPRPTPNVPRSAPPDEKNKF